MANLIVDIGNTALKASWCDGITLGKTYRYQGERMLDYILSMTEKERPEILVLSSVRNFSPAHVQKLRESCDRLLVVNEEMLASYGLPAWITPDRAASIAASRYLFKGRGCTIFDFGTTLTVDFLDPSGNFMGGNISRAVKRDSRLSTDIQNHFLFLMLLIHLKKKAQIFQHQFLPV